MKTHWPENARTATHTDGATQTLLPQGAHLLSWVPSSQLGEQLFVSKLAEYRPNVAVRGGVPICFPQFGAFGNIAKHGFARTADWQIAEHSTESLSLAFQSNEKTRQLWNHDFYASFTSRATADQLSMSLKVENTGQTPFEFTAALHTYFLVSHISNIQIHGLQGCAYWDNGTPLETRKTYQESILPITGAIDRVFFDTPTTLELQDKKSIRTITSSGFSDSVVWNPGSEGAQNLQDMDNEEYQIMICIESAAIDSPIELSPGESWEGKQTINVNDI